MKRYVLSAALLLLIIFFSAQARAEKFYLDINQPTIKKLSIAVEGLDNLPKVSEIIKDNLEFTEFFKVYGPFPHRGEKFEPSLWRASDVEIVARFDGTERISMKMFTVTNDKPIFTKEYQINNYENTAQLISADIYRALTGKESPFFNRFVFIRKFKNSMGILISNWNGKKISDTGIRREIISRAVLKGNSLFFSSLEGRHWQIEQFDMSTKTNRILIKSRALLQLGDVINESQFLFIQNDGDLSEIKMSNLSGQSKTLSSSRWIESSPRWHASKVYFVSNRAGSPQIYQIQEGTSPRRLTFQGKYNTEPAISPDGNRLVFSSLIGNFQLFTLEISSGIQTQITKEGNNEQPSFCPDGNFLTIMSDRRGKREIFLVTSDGLVQKPLTEGYLPYCSR
ncbi:hypothetical protein [Thermodesulfovibrio sp.]|uniref:hypothetical protein n=1 Tax=Thermodesulfovibrio sp. TaxID=2067987 RepID=UPI003096A3D9